MSEIEQRCGEAERRRGEERRGEYMPPIIEGAAYTRRFGSDRRSQPTPTSPTPTDSKKAEP